MKTSAFGARCAVVLVAHEVNNGWVDPRSTGGSFCSRLRMARTGIRQQGQCKGVTWTKSESERQ